jgi:hypothetical protein
MQNTAMAIMVWQTLVDEDKRGRVMSFYTMAFQGAPRRSGRCSADGWPSPWGGNTGSRSPSPSRVC